VPGVPYIMVLVQASIAWAIGSIAEGLSKQPDALAMAALSGPTKVGVAATTVMPGTPRGMNVVQKPMSAVCKVLGKVPGGSDAMAEPRVE